MPARTRFTLAVLLACLALALGLLRLAPATADSPAAPPAQATQAPGKGVQPAPTPVATVAVPAEQPASGAPGFLVPLLSLAAIALILFVGTLARRRGVGGGGEAEGR